MAKAGSVAVLDAALNQIKNGSNRMVVCSAQPLTYADVTTFKLAEVAMAPADHTLAAGDVSGRKTTTTAKTGIAIATSGTANHIALANSVALTLDFVTTCTAQALSTGGTVDVPAFKYEINNPT